MGKTGILLITICSNNKKQGGGPFAKESPSLLAALPEHASTIIKKRQAILYLLKSEEAIRDGIEISHMQLNSRLKLGPDFGGNESSLFMPAFVLHCSLESGPSTKDLHLRASWDRVNGEIPT